MVFFAMAPLLLLLRNPRTLHPHEPKAKRRVEAAAQVAEPEPELAGVR